LIRTMFSEKDQCHEKSHWACDIGHFRLSPILAELHHQIQVYQLSAIIELQR